MTELHHFHPAHKGSGSLCPFSIYPLYTRTVILSLDKPIADCFLFRPRKSCKKRRKRSHTNVSNTLSTRSSTPPAQTAHVRFHRRKRVHTQLCSENRTQRLTRRNRGLPDGALSLPSDRSTRSQTSPGRVSERRTLPLLGLGRVCSRKTQKAFGTAMRMMRVAVPRRRGPAGLRDLFTFVEVAACTPCAQGLSACAKEGWYHYPRCAPRAAETPDGRLSKRLICRFLRSGGRSSPHDSYFLANTQNFLLAVPVANAFALWYDKLAS